MDLSQAKVGEKLEIKKVKGQGPIKRRIIEMGMTKGQEIYIEKIAPLGDPIDIKVRGYDLFMRKEDAQMVEVERI